MPKQLNSSVAPIQSFFKHHQWTFKYWFLSSTQDSFVQFFRYLFVAGLAFVVDFSSLFAFTHWAGFHYLLSAALAFILGLITNYSLSIIWVFTERTMKSAKLEFLIFTGIGIAGLGLNELVIWLCTEFIGTHYLVSKIISTGLVFSFNFILRKILLFKAK
ncbi:MAG: GtrA family protein [Deltaproteobacteria bacterium]|nr:GtrA family protein [Deltaproteobacteria bacterium]